MTTTQEVVYVVDRSGSMRGKESDTIGGINASIDELKKTKGDDDIIKVSIKLFDHEEKLLHRSVKLDDICEFNITEFVPRGSTALLDAMGNTLTHFMEKKLLDPVGYDSCMILCCH